MFSLFSLFIFRGLFNTKAILVEEQHLYYLIHCWGYKGNHTFPKGICPKKNNSATGVRTHLLIDRSSTRGLI